MTEPRGPAPARVVIGVDIGTTAAKVVADPAVVATYRDVRRSAAGQSGDLAAAARLLSDVPMPDAR